MSPFLCDLQSIRYLENYQLNPCTLVHVLSCLVHMLKRFIHLLILGTFSNSGFLLPLQNECWLDFVSSLGANQYVLGRNGFVATRRFWSKRTIYGVNGMIDICQINFSLDVERNLLPTFPKGFSFAVSFFKKSPTIMLPFMLMLQLMHHLTKIGRICCLNYFCRIEACGLPLNPESLAALLSFASITFNVEETINGNRKSEVAKTGLGSSAAMTTAAVAVWLHYLGVVNLPLLSKDQNSKNEATLDLHLVHVIAQIAHCIAQGKVGIGFDVSSAAYGSQRYVRFSQ